MGASVIGSQAPNRELIPPEVHDLMRRVKTGDVHAFEAIVERYWGGAVAYAESLCADPDQAYDSAQEAFTRLWARRESWAITGSVRIWLLRTIRNLIISDQRKWKVRKLWSLRMATEKAVGPRTPLEITEQWELQYAIKLAVGNLPPRRREAFVLFHIHDLSYQEVATLMGVRPQTATNYVQAALIDLRTSLGKFLPAIQHPTKSTSE